MHFAHRLVTMVRCSATAAACCVLLVSAEAFSPPALLASARSLRKTCAISTASSTRHSVVLAAKKRSRKRIGDQQPEDTPPSADSSTGSGSNSGSSSDSSSSSNSKKNDVAEEEMYVRMPPLPSEFMQQRDRDEQNALDALQGKPGATDLLQAEMGGTPPVKGKGLVRTNKYSFDLDIELPVESESRDGDGDIEVDISKLGLGPGAKSRGLSNAPEGMTPLPDLIEVAKRKAKRQAEAANLPVRELVRRGDISSFVKLLELDPEADSDDSLFGRESYDYLSAALGEGKPFVGLPNSFLQSGHTVLVVLCVLCAFISYPGFPLTELPYDLRDFLQHGLAVVYLINTVLAVSVFDKAKKLGQPPVFWTIKTLVLGGLAYNELTQINAPAEPVRSKAKESRRARRNREL